MLNSIGATIAGVGTVPKLSSGMRMTSTYDLGPDGVPVSGDEPAVLETLIPPSGVAPILTDNGVYLANKSTGGIYKDFGPDHIYGTADDLPDRALPVLGRNGLQPAAGYGKIVSEVGGQIALFDLSAEIAVPIYNPLVGDAAPIFPLLGGPMLFGGGRAGPFDTFAAYFEYVGAPYAYRHVTDSTPRPGGWLTDSLLVLALRNDALPRLAGHVAGGQKVLDSAGYLFTEKGSDIDADAGRVVWIENRDTVMFFDSGADLRPGTADDVGPVALTTTSTPRRWPRIHGNIVVWSDLTGDTDGEWIGLASPNTTWDLVSKIVGVNLGVDGLPGGGDDQILTLTGGGKEIQPDVFGNTVVYLDYSADPTGVCEGNRGSHSHTNCTPALFSVPVTGGVPVAIDGSAKARTGLQINDDTVVWAEFNVAGASWDIHAMPLGGSIAVVAGDPTRSEWRPSVSGNKIAYWSAGPAVVDAGADGLFGNSDDIVVRPPPPKWEPICSDFFCLPFESRPQWLSGAWLVLTTGVMPVEAPGYELVGSVAAAPIPDDGTPLSDTVTLAADPSENVYDLRMEIVVDHSQLSELEIVLTSPTGDRVPLVRGSWSGSGLHTATFRLPHTASLLHYFGEPLGGDWTLEVIDGQPGNTGTLESWALRHLR